MAILRIERVPIKVHNLGWFGFDHLHIVLQQDILFEQQDRWYVMEGLRDDSGEITRLGVLGFEATISLSEANDDKEGDALVADIGTPAWRGSRIIDLGGQEFEKWFDMASYGRAIDDQSFPYIAYANPFTATSTINSSSVVASLLHHAGVKITDYFPTTLRISPGWETLLGTQDDDLVHLEWHFRYGYGGDGDDELKGQDDNIIPEKLYGGLGDDFFIATTGINYYNGGELGLTYAEDGIDTVSYEGIGVVTINVNRHASEHAAPEYYVIHSGGLDQFYSIEQVAWKQSSDEVILGPGIEGLPGNLKLKLGDQSSLDQGDKVDFSLSDTALVFNYDANGDMVVQTATQQGSTTGIWIESAEWVVGSNQSDVIYASATMRGVEGGEGDDLIDVRTAVPFTAHGPRSYDIEISGGGGDDTIVASSGWTIASGGDGADRFALSSMTLSDINSPIVELVIEDASAEDRVFIPMSLFDKSGGSFDGSALFPLLGAMAHEAGKTGFDDLPHEVGSPTPGALANGDYFEFKWQLQHDRIYGSDETAGVIPFTGAIHYNRYGDDLLIHIYTGAPQVIVEDGEDEEPWTHVVNTFDYLTETIVRVVDFEDGDLGIQFHYPGELTYAWHATDHGNYFTWSRPGWDAAVNAMTNGGAMESPLAPRPEAPAYEPRGGTSGNAPQLISGTDDGETIVATAIGVHIDAKGGDDSIEGSSGEDVLDGGAGSDTMSGGAGGDTYRVDSTSDVVSEAPGGGLDRVFASVSYALSANVEHLVLVGSASEGTGNETGNRLVGNGQDNMLSGLGGADVLVGGAGNDTLDGGEGSDDYVYALGDGDDVIKDHGASSDVDTLVLDGVVAAELAAIKLAAAQADLFLRLPDGSILTIEDFYGPEGSGIDAILFAHGVRWARSDIEALGDAAPVLTHFSPFAHDDVGFTAASGTVEFEAEDLLANDRLPDGGIFSIVAITDVTGEASVSLLAGDRLRLVTAEGYDGAVTFRYTVADGLGGTSSALVEVGIIPNHAPVASGALAAQTATPGAAWSYTLPAGHFTDADLDPLTFAAVLAGGGALPAWLSFDAASRTLSGTPPADAAGAIDILLTASDGLSQTGSTLQLVIGAVNRAPIAGSDTFTTQEFVALDLTAAGLLANDSDPDGDTLALDWVGDATGGSVSLAAGAIVFTPLAHFTGEARFSYTVSDGQGGSAQGQVTITVAAPPAGLVLTGTAGADTIIGTSGSDRIEGLAGTDVLKGNAGNDEFVISGDDGLDSFDGGIGYDTIVGGAGNDVIGLRFGSQSLISIEEIDGGDGFDVLRLSTGNDVLDLSGVHITGIEEIRGYGGNDIIIGSGGDDVIVGGAGADTLFGGGGNDVFLVSGSSGLDDIRGGDGFDVIQGGSANDTFSFASVAGNLEGIEAIDGGAGTNRIVLTSGNDDVDFSAMTISAVATISAGGGNDRIVASRSDDVLRGGSGADLFVFKRGTGHDFIQDFHRGTSSTPVIDVIDLTDFGFSDFASVIANAAQVGADTVITLEAESSLRLHKVSVGSLKVDDFVL